MTCACFSVPQRAERRLSLLPEHFARRRPYVYHLSHRDNLRHLRETGCLVPAAILMERAGRADLLRTPRRAHERVSVDGRIIALRDQRPLRRGNAGLSRGYAFGDLVESLNRRVFFWPGDRNGPIDYGVRHFEHYEHEHPIVLRVGFAALAASNPLVEPLFCRYNSGSPRCSYGRRSPRGPGTFLTAAAFDGTPNQVVEVTFENEIALPPGTEFAGQPGGPWRSLF